MRDFLFKWFEISYGHIITGMEELHGIFVKLVLVYYALCGWNIRISKWYSESVLTDNLLLLAQTLKIQPQLHGLVVLQQEYPYLGCCYLSRIYTTGFWNPFNQVFMYLSKYWSNSSLNSLNRLKVEKKELKVISKTYQ